jgi:hypothetical protein
MVGMALSSSQNKPGLNARTGARVLKGGIVQARQGTQQAGPAGGIAAILTMLACSHTAHAFAFVQEQVELAAIFRRGEINLIEWLQAAVHELLALAVG